MPVVRIVGLEIKRLGALALEQRQLDVVGEEEELVWVGHGGRKGKSQDSRGRRAPMRGKEGRGEAAVCGGDDDGRWDAW